MKQRAFVLAMAFAAACAARAADTVDVRLIGINDFHGNLESANLSLAIADPGQVVSVTHLAQQPAETPLWRQARRYSRNDGSRASVWRSACRRRR